MQPRCEGGDPEDSEFLSGVVVLEVVALETHCHMSWKEGLEQNSVEFFNQ